MRDFREEIRKSLKVIEAAWPDMEVDISTEGVTIKEGPLPVPLKAKHQLIQYLQTRPPCGVLFIGEK